MSLVYFRESEIKELKRGIRRVLGISSADIYKVLEWLKGCGCVVVREFARAIVGGLGVRVPGGVGADGYGLFAFVLGCGEDFRERRSFGVVVDYLERSGGYREVFYVRDGGWSLSFFVAANFFDGVFMVEGIPFVAVEVEASLVDMLSVVVGLSRVCNDAVKREVELSASDLIFLFGRNSPLYYFLTKVYLEFLRRSNRDVAVDEYYRRWREYLSFYYQGSWLSWELYLCHCYLVVLSVCAVYSCGVVERGGDGNNVATVEAGRYGLFFSRDNDEGTGGGVGIGGKQVYVLGDFVRLVRGYREVFVFEAYFGWLFDRNWSFDFLVGIFDGVSFVEEDVFGGLYQDLVSASARHNAGEYYTPSVLASWMVADSYMLGTEVLDPSCGTGVFVLEVIKRARKLSIDGTDVVENSECEHSGGMWAVFRRIYGCDINPVAVHLALANLLLVLFRWYGGVSGVEWSCLPGMYLGDVFSVVGEGCGSAGVLAVVAGSGRGGVDQCVNGACEGSDNALRGLYRKIGLLIGNPPWFVLNSVYNEEYGEFLRWLARLWGLYPSAHLVSNLEVYALFLGVGREYYLKDGGIFFFVTSKSLLYGDNHGCTRRFDGYDELEVWLFDKNLFGVPHVCVRGRYSSGVQMRTLVELKRLKVHVRYFSVVKDDVGGYEFRLREESEFVPYAVVSDGRGSKKGHYLVKRLVLKSDRERLLPLGENFYYSRCFNGATLYPRNLIFLKAVELSESSVIRDDTGLKNGVVTVKIRPLIEKAKAPWNFDPVAVLWDLGKLKRGVYPEVEREYIFRVLRSEGMVSFFAFHYDYAFLPVRVETSDVRWGYVFVDEVSTRAHQYFMLLDELYRRYQKKNARIGTLWENLDHRHKLTTRFQRSSFKCVMSGYGKTVKACVLSSAEDVVVDFSLYYVVCSSVDECYYLSGVLNAPLMTRNLQIVQTDRHIHKRPFKFVFPRYDPSSELHTRIVLKAKEMEKKVKLLVNEYLMDSERSGAKTHGKSNYQRWLQQLVYTKLNADFLELDALVQQLWL